MKSVIIAIVFFFLWLLAWSYFGIKITIDSSWDTSLKYVKNMQLTGFNQTIEDKKAKVEELINEQKAKMIEQIKKQKEKIINDIKKTIREKLKEQIDKMFGMKK